MTLEHYPGMAEAEIARHVDEAQARWPLLGVTVIHRYGRMVPGDNIVLVVTAASHRGDAFAAAEFLMDYLKTRAPFWKQEERPQGTTWVAAKDTDDAAADRWEKPAPPRSEGGLFGGNSDRSFRAAAGGEDVKTVGAAHPISLSSVIGRSRTRLPVA